MINENIDKFLVSHIKYKNCTEFDYPLVVYLSYNMYLSIHIVNVTKFQCNE